MSSWRFELGVGLYCWVWGYIVGCGVILLGVGLYCWGLQKSGVCLSKMKNWMSEWRYTVKHKYKYYYSGINPVEF